MAAGDPNRCGIYDVIEVLALNVMANATGRPSPACARPSVCFSASFDQSRDPARRARRNVRRITMISMGVSTSLFLDRDRRSSCAYFPRGDETLEETQLAQAAYRGEALCSIVRTFRCSTSGPVGVGLR